MTEGSKAAVAAATEAEAEASERALGRAVALGLPAATITASIVTGVVTSAGPAILVLVAGALLGTIALLWASLRTLGGDAPLPADLEAVAARAHDVDDAATRKKSVLFALKDLEHERSIGKIDEADYDEIATRYRAEAKAILREMDDKVAPMRARAEEIAAAYLKKRGLAAEGIAPEAPASTPARRACPACAASNEPDAVFCKACGASIVASRKESHDAP